MITDQQKLLGDLNIENYDNELLDMAHDLAARLLPAFENTQTGIPHPRVTIEAHFLKRIMSADCDVCLQVHLRNGVPDYGVTETCTAGAGTLLVEFGILSRLIKDPIYESYARRTLKSLWDLKNKDTGLLGEDLSTKPFDLAIISDLFFNCYARKHRRYSNW